ncbi:hypothetical protein [Dysgonomonas sp. 520]|uniref:hypothetical protein n=1 Tax=Dysgonomonas sp. 520 TaxID=2302931 RepID=UPI0013D71B42|nr:hypothetical protein [Dysgonomonas sp. 520]NDW11090.1 hypothetical protein [Dysgonomonas sp. 520]
MKKKLLLLTLLACSVAYGQVGVNTESPQGIFHIDGQRNTNGNTNISDDVVVKTDGNVGIGTNDPQAKVDIRTATQGEGFRLQDGSQGNGMVLTSDATGNGKWSAPGFSDFTRVEPKIFSFSIPTIDDSSLKSTSAMLKNVSTNQTYSIEMPFYGTYSFTLGMRIVFTNLRSDSYVDCVVIQLLPRDDISIWNAASPRFPGSYEVYGQKESFSGMNSYRFYLSENITISTSTGRTVYFAVSVRGRNLPSPLTGSFSIGSVGGCPQCTGGSYVRIN